MAKEKDGTALRRLVITEEEKAGVFELSATLLLFLDTPAAIILLGKSKNGFTGLTTTRTRWKWLVTNCIYLPITRWHPGGGGRGALGYFLGGYVPPETPNCHPVPKKISPKIDTPF